MMTSARLPPSGLPRTVVSTRKGPCGKPVPSLEDRDLQQLLWHRHRLVQMRTRILNQLQAVAMNEGIQRRGGLRSEQGRKRLEQLPLAPWATRRREDLLN